MAVLKRRSQQTGRSAGAAAGRSADRAVVHLCSDPACDRLDDHAEWITVRPGSATDEQVYWDPGQSTGYAVATDPATGSPRQCLVVTAAAKASTTVDTPLSSAGRCEG